MLSDNSPFLNLPIGLDQKQAIFLDGMRHAVQIIDFSYMRLCQALTRQALNRPRAYAESQFTHVFLDAWAFVDAVDRFRSLWEMQPNAERLPKEYSPSSIRSQLQTIRDTRNVSAHIAQKIDQIVSLNASALGAINWITLLSKRPLKVNTYFIRPGIMKGRSMAQFAMPQGKITFRHGSACISLAAGKHYANLSEAHRIVGSIVRFAESTLKFEDQESRKQEYLPRDAFGSAELDTGDS